ncbi:MAG: SGNH/GDSL hydrolase family protein [Chloroflexota bacterium]
MTLPILLLAIVLIGALLVGLIVQRRLEWLRNVGKGLFVSYITIVMVLAAGEIYFRYFHVDTDGRLASNNWMARYWHTNAQGFRDRDWTPADWAGKTTIAAVGDSLTAGWGIDNPADRFTDVLAGHLGDDYVVFNLGVPGESTPEELNSLRNAPTPAPNVVILQYFLNDIDYAALTLGLNKNPPPVPDIAQESFLANYLYALSNSGFGVDYWATEYANYDNFAIWNVHEKELNDFVDTIESIHARLIVVIFPNLQDPVRSVAYVDRVAQVFEARGENDILKLYDEVAAWSPEKVIVSPHDAHPSIAFQQRVGDLIYQQFFAPPS